MRRPGVGVRAVGYPRTTNPPTSKWGGAGQLVQILKVGLSSELGLDESILWKHQQKEHLIESIFRNVIGAIFPERIIVGSKMKPLSSDIGWKNIV